MPFRRILLKKSQFVLFDEYIDWQENIGAGKKTKSGSQMGRWLLEIKRYAIVFISTFLR